MTAASIALRRLAAQRLVGDPLPTPTAVVRHLVAVQSQDYAGAKWAVAQRATGATDADLDRMFDAGAFVRLHAMRPTWHFVAAEDLRWLLTVTGPRVHQASAFRYRQLEIDDRLAGRAADVFERVLAGGRAMTRDELARELQANGIAALGQRLPYLLSHAEVEAILCSGPRRDGRQTFALVAERVPASKSPSYDEALAEVARRYVEGHGPAQDVDLAWWSGLTLRDARRGLAAAGSALDRETVDARTFWTSARSRVPPPVMASAPTPTTVHLLPNYDELLVAFRDRRDALDPALPPPARVAQEILNHVIVRDGLVVGRWRRSIQAGRVAISVDPLVPLNSAERRLLAAAVDRYVAFLGRPVQVTGLD